MFFRMLWHDLRNKKGLNVILFLFMTVASALVFVSAAQIYSSFTGVARTKAACKIADGVLICNRGSADRESRRTEIEAALHEDAEVISFVRQERIYLNTAGIDFAHFEEAESDSFVGKSFYLCPQQTDANLVYGLNDEPFFLHNGQVAVPLNVKIQTGASVGDKLRITTDMGNIYELEIAQFYKRSDPYNRLIVSAGDYDVLCGDFPVRQDLYQITLKHPSSYELTELYSRMFDQTGQIFGTNFYMRQSQEQTFSSIVALFLTAISIFMIRLIFMTIRFTLIAALKEEERSIGMMRAIGVDSFGFRWLFAAKYIAFALVGGLIGTAAGFPLCKRVLLEFCPNALFPPDAVLLLIGAGAVLLIAALMILFTLSVMGRIRRSSVMEALRGESRMERFAKSSPLRLHRTRWIPVTLFLAVSDILTRLKRYLFLIVSYTLGAAILLLVVNLRFSLMSTNYLRYDMISNLDFCLDLSKAQMKHYNDVQRYEGIPFWQQINDELAEAGIPAGAKLYYLGSRALTFNGKSLGKCRIAYGMPEPEKLLFREGTVPQKAGECAVSCYTADQYGIKIGSVIEVSLIGFEEEEPEQFVVTGLINYLEQNTPLVLAGREYLPAYVDAYPSHYCAININAEDKQAVFAQLCEHFGAEHVQTPAQFMEDYMGEYATIVTTMMYAVSAVVLVVLTLMTVLYQNLFLTEDKPETVLLRALGFPDGTIAASQLLRMLLLITASIAVAIVLVKTGGLALVRVLMGIYVGLTGFVFEPLRLFTYLLMPLMLLAVVLIPTALLLMRIRHTDIRSSCEE